MIVYFDICLLVYYGINIASYVDNYIVYNYFNTNHLIIISVITVANSLPC